MRLILQLCLLVLMLLGAEKRAWGKVATSPQTAVRDWVQDSRLGGGIDAPPRQPTSREAAAWNADMASAGDIHREDTLTMAGPIVVTSHGAAFLMCPGAPPPFIGSFRTTTPACVAYGPNLYAYVMQNPWTGWDPHRLADANGVCGTMAGSWFQIGGFGLSYDQGDKGVLKPVAGAGYPSGSGYVDAFGNWHQSFCISCHNNTSAAQYNLHMARTAHAVSWKGFGTEMETAFIAAPLMEAGAVRLFAGGISGGARTLTSSAMRQAERTLVQTSSELSDLVMASQRNAQRAAVLSGIMDSQSGQMFFATNKKALPQNRHPILDARLEALKKAGGQVSEKAGVAGHHSEIHALNDALLAREAATGVKVTEDQLGDFLLHNRSLRGTTKGTGRPPRCDNCKPLTKGVRVVGHD